MEPQDCTTGGDLLRTGLTDEELDAVVAGIEAIWRGRAPEVADSVFTTLADAGRAEIDAHGRLVGVHGFTLHETRHGIVHDGVTHHVWCGYDSVGIPAAFGLDAVATSDCPHCGKALHVEIARGEPEACEVVLWLPVPEGTSHLMQQFCANADLFCSRAHLAGHVDAAKMPGRVLALPEAAALGRETWADVSHAGITGMSTPVT